MDSMTSTAARPIIYDQEFEWRFPERGFLSRCHLRVVRTPDYDVVIASELATNPGMSICNAFCWLAPMVAQRFSLDPSRLCWIEHWGPFSYPDGNRDTEEFSLVRYEPGADRFFKPQWKYLSREKVEEILGIPLPPFPF